jgi:hypothetical protein
MNLDMQRLFFAAALLALALAAALLRWRARRDYRRQVGARLEQVTQ